MITPGAPTIMKTDRQLWVSSNRGAMIGASARPNREIMHWKMPLFRPRREGLEASTATATPVEATGPSAIPMMTRTKTRATRDPTMPLNADISENTRMAGTSTARRPILSAMYPITNAEIPQAMPRYPASAPPCWGVNPRSLQPSWSWATAG